MKDLTTRRTVHEMVKCPRGEITRMIFTKMCREGGVEEDDGCVFFHHISQNENGSHDVICNWPVLPESEGNSNG